MALTGLVALAQPASAAGATVTGRFVTEDGQPVDAIKASLVQGGSNVDSDTSGIDGTFTFTGVTAGSYTVNPLDPFGNYLAGTVAVTVVDGETKNLGDIELNYFDDISPLTPLTGIVRDTAGKPVRGIRVVAFAPAPTQPGFDGPMNATTDRTGRYQFLPQAGGGPGPGTYKLYFRDDEIVEETFRYGVRYSGDQPTWARATTVTVDNTLRTVPDVTVTQVGGISGTLTGTVPMTAGSVTVYDADGDQVGAPKATGPGGAYSFTTLRPGSYVLRFSSPDGGGSTFVRTFWPGAASIADATPVVVKSGQFRTGVNQVLSTQLTAFRKPTISGRPVVGSTLTASPGSWSLTTTTEYSYAWLRGAAVVGTAKTYRPVAADAGKTLSVRVTARSFDRSGIATSSPTATVKWVSAVSGRAAYVRAKKRLLLTVRVTGLSNPGGTVTVKEGARTVKARVAVRNGTAVITVLKPKPGRHTYTLLYSGTSTVLAATGRVAVKIPKR
ncbi:hypothetical protein EFK50_19265 [Nocardioides marmoriginsengisoli]|uniref:alpha-amylase n=1 Tax=Nocardioides marmoriginsengisoli TaxID=661483 RepID=A0A3N0CAH8_9ACTN|nr:hypothetical protein EFK50_19265 [Nocardioides marmoriginsengisoli]